MALKGIRVVELAGLAPAPFCGMLLADFGASVIRVDRANDVPSFVTNSLARGKRSIAVNLQSNEGVEIMKRLCKSSDVLLEPFRPGKMENLGLGPTIIQKMNPRLIYARLSGFGQTGTFADVAGHDINYTGVSGVLSMLAPRNKKPSPPINILADFAGGGMLCALGICLALLERIHSGKGQIIDASMTEGTAYLATWLWKTQGTLVWGNPPGYNLLDGGAAFYQTYATKDGKYMAVGALEPKFYSELLKGLDLDENDFPQFSDRELLETEFTKKFLMKTQKEWWEIFKHRDACVTPVVNLQEASNGEYLKERSSHLRDGAPRPAPQLSRTPAEPMLQFPQIGEQTEVILKELGYSNDDIDRLLAKGVVSASVPSKL